VKAANVEVETIWTSLFAKALEGKDVTAMLSNVGSGGAAPAAVGGAAPAAGGAAEEKKEEKKEEAKEESDDDMGFGTWDPVCSMTFAPVHIAIDDHPTNYREPYYSLQVSSIKRSLFSMRNKKADRLPNPQIHS
jgi:large subunit ribosomal protein LP1